MATQPQKDDTPPLVKVTSGTSADAPTSEAQTSDAQAPILSFRQNPLKFSWKFCKEIFNEHEFWLNTIAVRGGTSAIVAGLAVALGFTVGFPLALTAAIIAGVGIVGSLALYGVAAGGLQAWQGLKRAYHKACGLPEKQLPPVCVKTLQERLAEKPWVKKCVESKLGQKIKHSRAWNLAKKITHEDNLVGGLAVGGSILALAIGIPLLITQIAVLPVVAAGTVLTWGMVMAVSSISSGVTGMYFSVVGLKHRMHRKREERIAARKEKKEQRIKKLEPEKKTVTGFSDQTIAADFNSKVETIKPALETTHRPEEQNKPGHTNTQTQATQNL